MTKFSLLIKSKKIANQAGYYLKNGRWHAIDNGKKVPKGASVAKHPTAAGEFSPTKHLTDEQWDVLKLPDTNANAKTHNKKLAEIQALSDAGNVAGILGMQYGTNTYAKQLVIIANNMLAAYGVEHKVSPGQKAGEHAAVKAAEDEPAAADKPEAKAEVSLGQFEGLKSDIDKAAEDGDQATLASIKKYLSTPQAKSHPDAKAALEYLASKAAPQADKSPPKEKSTPNITHAGYTIYPHKTKSGDMYGLQSPENKQKGVTGFGDLLFSSIDEAKSGAGKQAAQEEEKKQYAEKLKAEKEKSEKDEAEAKAKKYGLNGFLEGKTEVQKHKIASHLDKMLSYKGKATSLRDLIESAIGKGGKVVVDEFGDKFLNNDPSDPDVGWTQKTLSKIGMDYAEFLQSKQPDQNAMPIPDFAEGVKTAGVKVHYEKTAGKINELVSAGDLDGLNKLKADGLKPNSKGKVGNTWNGKTANSKKLLGMFDAAVEKLGGKTAATEAPKAAEKTAPAAPEAKPEPASETKPAAAPNAKLDQIPWDKQLLPDSNTNAKSHNGKVAQIKAMAYAGDVAGLEAFKAGKNTYGKKQNLLAQTALAALKETESAQPAPEPAPAVAETKLEPAVAADTEQASKAEDGPQDGDTKQGAEGMLVFKNGRWHKVAEAEAAAEPTAADQHPVDAVELPDLPMALAHNKDKIHNALKGFKEKVKQDGVGAFKGTIKNMKASGKTIITIPHGNTSLKVHVYGDDHAFSPLIEHMAELKAAAGGKPSKAKAKPATAAKSPSIDADGIEHMDSWQQTGPQGGSNPGGKFKDHNGVEWYCKFPDNEDMAKSEILAAKLYALAGVAGQQAKLIKKDGKIGIASKWVDVSKAASPTALAKTAGVAEGFAVDAWLGNWDVVGMAFDNLQVGADGKAVRVDAGGSLTYRAQGGKKAFTAHVTEIDSLRDPGTNPQAAAVFGKLSDADIAASVHKVLAIPDAAIDALVKQHGGGSDEEKQKLAETLKARKADLAVKFPKAAKEAKAPKPKAEFKIENLTTPPNFNNWNGEGKGLSSHAFINNANQAAVESVYDAAKKGDLPSIQNATAPMFDKGTGEVVSHVPLQSHPSQHVKAYWADMVNEVDLQLNPPRMPELGTIAYGDDVDVISAMLQPVPTGKAVAAIDKHKKVGNYILLGKIDSIAPVVPKEDNTVIASSTWKDKATSAYQASSGAARQTFSTYLSTSGASALNTALRTGGINQTVGGKSVTQHVEDFKELLIDVPEGSTFVRRMGNKGYGSAPNPVATKEMQQFLLSAEPGSVVQEPGFSSTSWTGGNKILGNNDIEWEFVAGKGVKMFPAWLTANSGEGEGLLPPNQRYAIISSKKDGKTVRVKAILLPTIE